MKDSFSPDDIQINPVVEPTEPEHESETIDFTLKPITIPVANLRKRLGQQQSFSHDFTPDKYLTPEGALNIGIVARTSSLNVVLESIENGVSLNGSVNYFWSGDCRRCLETIEQSSVTQLSEVYKQDVDAEIDDTKMDIVRPFDGVNLDISEAVAEAMLVELPLMPLCSDSCKGPDSRYFVDQSDSTTPQKDPRWDALNQIKF